MLNAFLRLSYGQVAALAVLLGAAVPGFGQAWSPAQGHIMTRWAKDVDAGSPLPEYPRPQMSRNSWQSLNGLWDYAVSDQSQTKLPTDFANQILVPFPYESALSGVGKASIPDQRLWYRRTFTVPGAWHGQHVLLHFGAVNWDSTVTVNGKPLGEHKGGFDAFTYDITDALESGANTLIVSVSNPLKTDSADAQVVGKQRLHPETIFYTASTGIWQTVWLEPVPIVHIDSFVIVPDIDAKALHVTVKASDGTSAVKIRCMDGQKQIAAAEGPANTDLVVPVPDPHLWSPEDPHLYDLHISLDSNGKAGDAVDSYFAMRKISLGKDEQGRTRIFLNNKFVLEIGALDQGFWPDGIYTAPTDEALKSDISAAKSLGFNLLRKHAKVEPERWYYWADKLGMLVWQDMPQCFDKTGAQHEHILSDEAKAQWIVEWKRILAQRRNNPSIIVWTTFNEGWGQHDTQSIVAMTKQLDPTRLVNDASGWDDKGVGDIKDTHAYPGPWCEKAGDTRASVNGEFGGLTMRVPGHMWTPAVFGYGSTLRSGWKVTRQYQKLLQTAFRLRDERGASAFVYTQLTDVERESNGLLTYDRAVIKPFGDFIKAANSGLFPPLPPAPPSTELVATSEDEPANWSYTTTKPGDDWATPAFDASAWKVGPAPFGHKYHSNTAWTDTPGDIWIRRTINLSTKIPQKLVVRTLHDEDVEVYINGVLAASASGFNGSYVDLPMSDAARAALRPGQTVIAAHCRQTVGGQVIDVGVSAADDK